MRRPSTDVLLTLVLVVALGAGAAVAWVARPPAPTAVAPDAGTTTSAPLDPAPTSRAPSPTASPKPRPPRRPARTPRPPAVTASSCPDLSTEVPLRVVSFNIHFGIGPDGFDLARLAATIRGWDADVVMLQEVDRFRKRSRYLDVPAELARLTGMEAAYGANVLRGGSQYGVATLSRFPIVRDANTLLPNRPGLEQRGLLRTDVDVDGTVVSVFNTHLQNGVRSMRSEQVAAIRPLVLSTTHPVVVGGDFNSGPGSPQMRVVGTVARDAWYDGGSGPGLTAPARAPRYRIDYVLYTQPLSVVSARVLPEVISDHRAVQADLLLSVAGEEVCVPELDGALGQGGAGAGSGTGGRDD